MARIPMGNLGQSMPQVDRVQLPQNQSGQMVATAFNNFAEVAAQADQRQREQEAQQKQIALYHDKLATDEAKIKLDDVLTSELSDQVVAIKDQVLKGAISADTGKTQLQTWSESKYKEMEATLPLHSKQQLDAYWKDNIDRQSNDFLPLQLRADVQKSELLAERAFDIATRYDEQKGREYLDEQLGKSTLSEMAKYNYRQKYNTTRNLMSIDDRITTAVQNSSVTDLEGLLKDLRGGQFAYVDGPTIQDKEKQVLSRIGAIQQQKQVEENKRIAQAGQIFNDYKTNVLTGRAMDTEYSNNVGAAVAGTEYEGEYQFYKAQSENFQKFGRLTTSEQLKAINEQKARRKNSSSANAQTEDKILAVYEQLYQEKLSTIKDNPSQAVREAGLKPHTLTAVELKSNGQSFAKKAIDNGLSQLALKDANIKLQPISTEDLPEAKQAFEGMSVNAKLNFIGSIIGQSKNVTNGQRIWGATLQQLGGADRTYYLAGMAKLKNRGIGSEKLADNLVNGGYLISKGGFIVPTDLEQKFREKYGNLSSYGNFNDDWKAFQNVYASLANKTGVSHTKKDDVSNNDVAQRAFEMSTGGVYNQKPGSWFGGFKTSDGGSFKDWKVPKPYGMNDETFEAHLEYGYQSLAKMSGHSVDDLKDFRLKPRIDGKTNRIMYSLINMRGEVLKGPSGGEQFMILNGVAP